VRIKSERDFWSGVMFVAVGIGFAVGASNYALLGAIVLFKSLTIETEGGDPVGSFAWRPLIIVVASITVFGLLLPRAGMFITIPILIVMVSFATTEFRWIGVVINAAVLTIFAWLVFVVGLKLTIPLWPTFIGS
jgi:hypothetical protein